MKTTSTFDLLFLEPGKDDLPGPPISHVYLKSSTSGGYRGVSDDLRFVTAQCMGPAEVDFEIDRLHRELEEIRKAAHRKYAQAAAKRRKPA